MSGPASFLYAILISAVVFVAVPLLIFLVRGDIRPVRFDSQPRQGEVVQDPLVLIFRSDAPRERKITGMLAALPQAEDLRQADPHRTPEAVMRAGAQIGILAAAAQQEQEVQLTDVLHGLHACAESDRVVDAIRALCFRFYPLLLNKVTARQTRDLPRPELPRIPRRVQEMVEAMAPVPQQ